MTRKTAICGIFTSLAIVVSALERLIPLQLIIPLPGIKLGLANCIIMFVLLKFGFFSALLVLLIKCTVVALLFSGPISFVFSLTGGVLSLLGMFLLLRFRSVFSLCGVSVFGAALHNTGQIIAAAVMLGSTYIFGYLPMLLFFSVITGIITGILSEIICKRIEV